MAAIHLFRFDFESRMLMPEVKRLTEATGMIIKDPDNSYRDSPGHGSIGDNVDLYLRRGDVEGKWIIQARTHDPDYDRRAVEACRDRVREVLPLVATSWSEATP
jgi:hypothetical protein